MGLVVQVRISKDKLGDRDAIQDKRQAVLNAACAANPRRFTRRPRARTSIRTRRQLRSSRNLGSPGRVRSIGRG